MYVISWLQLWENIRRPEWNGYTMPNVSIPSVLLCLLKLCLIVILDRNENFSSGTHGSKEGGFGLVAGESREEQTT